MRKLSRIQQIIIIAIIAIILVLITSGLIYNYTGWKNFSMKKGENFQLTDPDPDIVSKIKFKNCIFNTKGVDGTTKTYTVTSVLNGMTSAYKGNKNSKYIFKLDDPGLSPYSFQIPGFNDKDNHPDVANWGSDLPQTEATLTGAYKIVN